MKVVTEANAKWESYLGTIQSITFGSLATDFLSFTILYNYIVPISLYVTIGKNHVFLSFLRAKNIFAARYQIIIVQNSNSID